MERLKVIDTSTSDFEGMMQNRLMYIDKTSYFYTLATQGKLYFVSRPRRSGKTLMVSTLEAIFQGKKELFGGLYIYGTDYDWKAYPILHFSFNIFQGTTNKELIYTLDFLVSEMAEKHGVKLEQSLPYYLKFGKLIDTLAVKDKVVILVDEYDKVLSDNIFNPEVETMRATMKGFYEVIKAKEACLRFVFITGVTKYAKLSIFSTMNNLTDLTMDKDYATMLGYTQEEFESNFAGYIEKGVRDSGMSRDEYLAKVKRQYDGFRFAPGCETVYNPVSIGKFFTTGHGVDFDNYWSETGGTQLLMDIARKVNFNVLTDFSKTMNSESLKVFDILSLASKDVSVSDLMALLLQTGYLTIDREKPGAREGTKDYFLRFPNGEVENSFVNQLLNASVRMDVSKKNTILDDILIALQNGKTAQVIESLTSILASIPYPTETNEHTYQSVIGLVFFLEKPSMVQAEVHTSEGRIDMVLRTEKHLYVIEFKMNENAETAIGQIKSKEYVGRFLAEKGKVQIHLLGISLSSEKRNIVEWKEEIL